MKSNEINLPSGRVIFPQGRRFSVSFKKSKREQNFKETKKKNMSNQSTAFGRKQCKQWQRLNNATNANNSNDTGSK